MLGANGFSNIMIPPLFDRMRKRLPTTTKNQKERIYAKRYGELKAEIGKILRQLCEWKQVTILEAELCPDYIHILIEIPPKVSVSGVVGFLKGKSSLMIHERHGNLKYKYGNRSFWCRGFYVNIAVKNAKKIAEYIQNGLKEDQLHNQMTLSNIAYCIEFGVMTYTGVGYNSSTSWSGLSNSKNS